jgi:CRP-like cAMP-binding protein
MRNPVQEATAMKCPNCQAETGETARYCNHCGHDLESQRTPDGNLSPDGAAADILRPLSGFRRNLSTELAARQAEMRILVKFNELLELRTYQPGEIIIHKGDKSRDLFFLTEGLVEISTDEGTGNVILNEIESPDIIGDIAFLSGFPRTATALAKTKVRLFVLKYQDFRDLFRESPDWVQPLLTSFVSGIRTLHSRIKRLERKVSELKGG